MTIRSEQVSESGHSCDALDGGQKSCRHRFFDIIVAADMMWLLEEIIPCLLEYLSSIETNRLGY